MPFRVNSYTGRLDYYEEGADLSGYATIDYVDAGTWLFPPIIDFYDPTGGLPEDPEIGDRYISDATASGWTYDYIYEWDGEEWVESPPEEGWMIWCLFELMFYVFFSGGWMEVGSGSFLNLDETNWTADSPLSFDTDTKHLSVDLSGKENVGVAAGLDAQHLLDFAHGDIAHTNRTALNAVSGVNTGDQTSIKKTRTFGRTWTTGDSGFIKTKMAFLADANFVRVFKDGVLLTYSTDWTFNTTNGKKLGVVDDLTDGVQILSPVNSSVYRVEFDEYLTPLCPMIGLKRSDGKMPQKGLPRNTITDDGRSGIISNSSYDDVLNEYTITYKKPDTSTFTLVRRYADRAFCCDFDFNKALPDGWRIEVYKVGRHWSGNRASAPGDDYETMNSILSPRFVVTTNIFSLIWLFDKKRSGQVKIKLRNTTTNEVSLFSSQTICARQFKYMDRTWTPFGVRYNKITLK